MKSFCLFLVIFLGLSVSGCVSLPPLLTYLNYAKTAADVGSYATTDKSTTDHAVSAITKKDCNLFRFVMDKKVCKEHKKKEERNEYTQNDIWTPDSMKKPDVVIDLDLFDGV